jgi:hypothetical protein
MKATLADACFDVFRREYDKIKLPLLLAFIADP